MVKLLTGIEEGGSKNRNESPYQVARPLQLIKGDNMYKKIAYGLSAFAVIVTLGATKGDIAGIAIAAIIIAAMGAFYLDDK